MNATNQTYSESAVIPTYGLFNGTYKLSIDLTAQRCYITGDGNSYVMPIISSTGDEFHPDLWILDGRTIECKINRVNRKIVVTPSNGRYRNSGDTAGVFQYFTFNGQRIRINTQVDEQ